MGKFFKVRAYIKSWSTKPSKKAFKTMFTEKDWDLMKKKRGPKRANIVKAITDHLESELRATGNAFKLGGSKKK